MTANIPEEVSDYRVAELTVLDARGAPLAWPVTPYEDKAGRIVVTSTIAYARKMEHARRDGRVALLYSDWRESGFTGPKEQVLVVGQASIEDDFSGELFVREFLSQETAKYPPTTAYLKTPFRRFLLDWYFRRVILTLQPESCTRFPAVSKDGGVLAVVGDGGFPVARRWGVLPPSEGRREVTIGGAAGLPADGGRPACLLWHDFGPRLSGLRQLLLRGTIRGPAFTVESRWGSLAAPIEPSGLLAQVRQALRLKAAGRRYLAARGIRAPRLARLPP